MVKRNIDKNRITGLTFGLYLYFLIDFFLHLSSRIPGYGVIRPTLLLALIITIFLISQSHKFKGFSKDPIVRVLIVLLVYIVLSLPFVEWPGSVIKNNLPTFIKAIVFFFFTAIILDNEKRFRIFLYVFVSCQIYRVLEPLFMNIAYGYWGSGTYLGEGEFASRLAGSPYDVINPNELGFVIVTIIPFLHYLLWGAKARKAKYLYLILMPLLLYAMILTQSRGAMIALMIVFWMIFIKSNYKPQLIIVFIFAAIIMWSNMSSLQKERYLSLIGMSDVYDKSAEGRITGMKHEFELALNRPVVGHGIGTTPEVKVNIGGGGPQAAHSLYAELIIEIGIIGFVLFIRFLYKIYQQLMKNNKALTEMSEIGDLEFHENMNKVLVALFWMYAVYSFNYWGLSQYYWYLYGGISLVFAKLLNQKKVY